MNAWQQTAESVRNNLESLAVWRATSARTCEREKPVTYTANTGLLACQSVRRGGSFVSVWTLDGAKIARARALALIAERMESRMVARK
jgi:hypothetical protein